VHQDLYDRLQKSAGDANLSLSEEAERRVLQAFAWEEQLGEMKKARAEFDALIAKGMDAALRARGYQPIHDVNGTVWAEPGMELGKFTGALNPAIVQAIEEAMRRVIKSKGEE
jgi:hypothetical protein